MVSKYLAILCELCVMMVSSSIVKRSYQDIPLQMCPQNAACSEIYSLSSQGLGPASYMIQFKCKCPSNSECPSMPGAQTISTDVVDKWYGLCQSVEDIPRCQPGNIAEQIILDAPELNSQSYVKMWYMWIYYWPDGTGNIASRPVHCTCPGHDINDGNPATMWSGSRSDKYVHNLVCSDDIMTKRGRYGGGGSRSRGRFYFYRK